MSVPTSKLQGLGMTISTCVINLGSSGNCVDKAPSFPKRGLRISTGKSEEPKFLILDLSLSEAKGNVVN